MEPLARTITPIYSESDKCPGASHNSLRSRLPAQRAQLCPFAQEQGLHPVICRCCNECRAMCRESA